MKLLNIDVIVFDLKELVELACEIFETTSINVSFDYSDNCNGLCVYVHNDNDIERELSELWDTFIHGVENKFNIKLLNGELYSKDKDFLLEEIYGIIEYHKIL